MYQCTHCKIKIAAESEPLNCPGCGNGCRDHVPNCPNCGFINLADSSAPALGIDNTLLNDPATDFNDNPDGVVPADMEEAAKMDMLIPDADYNPATDGPNSYEDLPPAPDAGDPGFF